MIPFLITFAAWAVVHSFTASLWFKQVARRWMGDRGYDGLYRLLYNLLAFITFIPVLYFSAALLPQGELWVIPQPFNLIFVAIQLAAAIGLLISALQTDLMRFAGVGQALRYIRGDEEINPPPRLVTAGAYGLVRHPLYSLSLLFLWITPIMTWSILLFNIAATLYFWIGSIYEERRLTAIFGDEYLVYKQKVPRLFPVKIPL
jgi:protein-S-isoprenylcysteine O-methyltransferase Ste14